MRDEVTDCPQPGADREAALQKRLRLYQAMFECGSLVQLIVDYRSFRIDVVNDAFCNLTGFSPEELAGKDVAVIFPPGQNPAANTVERLAAPATTSYSVERFLQRRDGTILPVLSTVSAVRDDQGLVVKLLVLFQDLTERRVAEEGQRRSQALIDAAITTLPVTFTAFDSQLRVTFIAGGLARAGTRPEDFLGKHISDITDDPITLDAHQDALAGRESTTRIVRNGETYLTLTAPQADGARGVVGAISVTSNITAEVRADAKRRRVEELALFTARHDRLTGLLGRSALVEHLDGLAAAGRGGGRSCCSTWTTSTSSMTASVMRSGTRCSSR